MSSLVTALALEDPNGDYVSLMVPRYRGVQRVEGLRGLRTREFVRAKVGRHGTQNRSRHRDDRSIVITGLTRGEDEDRAWAEWDDLAYAFAGAVDTDRWLRYTLGTDLHLQSRVRLVETDPPAGYEESILRYQVALRNSDSRAYSQDLVEVIASASAGNTGGLTFPMTFPLVFEQPASNTISVTHSGSVPTPAEFTLVGYAVDPVIQIGDDRLVFDGTVGSGDRLKIDTATRTVILNDTADRINLLVSEESRWFELPARKTSLIDVVADELGAEAQLEVRFRHAY